MLALGEDQAAQLSTLLEHVLAIRSNLAFKFEEIMLALSAITDVAKDMKQQAENVKKLLDQFGARPVDHCELCSGVPASAAKIGRHHLFVCLLACY